MQESVTPTQRRSVGPTVLAGGQERMLRTVISIVRLGPVLIMTLAAVTMTILSPYFLTEANLQNLGVQAAIIGCVATGMLLVILAAGVDLSVGSVVGLGAVVGLQTAMHVGSPTLVLVSMVGVGLGVGLLNGALLVRGRAASPIIVTLATLGVARGLALVISDGKSEFGLPGVVTVLGSGFVGPVPVAVLVTGGLAAIMVAFTQLTQWGKWIYAVGAAREAARRAGIPDGRVLMSVYILCGTCAGIGSILIAGQSGVAQPTAGQLLELDAITAVIIGGASFFGGRGTVGNVMVGALILAIIRNGLNLLSVDAYLQQVAIGALILIAVQLDSLRSHLEGRFRTTQALAAP